MYRGFELAYYLLRISAAIDKKPLTKLIRSLATYLIESQGKIQIGIPWFHHTLYNNEPKEKTGRPVTASFDSEHFVRESTFLLRLVRDFPDVIK